MAKIDPGRFYRDGREVELLEGSPDVWICRREEDFPAEKIPAAARFAECTECGHRIVYNPAHVFDRPVPRVCMQCAGIKPEPIV